MELKDQFKKLVEEIQVKNNLTGKALAERLGYDRAYFSSLLGSRADQVTGEHIKALKLHFPELENPTTTPADIEEVKESGRNELLEKAIFNLSEAELINAKNMERLTKLLERKWDMVGMELPDPGTEGTVTMQPNEKAAQ